MNRTGWMWAVVFGSAVAAGCSTAEEKWENPSVSQSTWEVHEAECRRLANQRAEQEYAPVEPVIAETFGRQTTYRTQVARYDAQQRRDYLFDRCMKDRGYRRTTRPSPVDSTSPAPSPSPGR